MEQTTVIDKNEKLMRSLRFGGISPVVLRELSGVYQPFVKAVKEIISNAYDADAEKVGLDFRNNFETLMISDNGSGMNPIEFVRDYIRIGKSQKKDEHTAKKRRPRIGGKGIGFLAPARYCNLLEVRTKKAVPTQSKLNIDLNEQLEVDVSPYLLQGHGESVVLNYITIDKVEDLTGAVVHEEINGFRVRLNKQLEECVVFYTFDSSSLELTASIDFNALFALDSSKSLEDIDNFCSIRVDKVSEDEVEKSYTKVTLHEVKDFVRKELADKGKSRARNVESFKGIDQFLWNLSRIIPVKAKLHENLPAELREFVKVEMDGEDKEYPIDVDYSIDHSVPESLERYIIQPDRKMGLATDSDIVKLLNYGEAGDEFIARGFLVGQSSTIFPAECRGILLKVKGVAIGEPTYFGLDQILTGSSKVALSQISGEINIIHGIDAINDINPGRDGFYKESHSYNLIKKQLIGDNPDKLSGDLKDVINAIILRSEVNASISNFVKRHEGQRKAILEAGAAVAELSYEDPSILDQFLMPKPSYELQLAAGIQYKADGKLASYTVKLVDDLEEQYKIDYVSKELLLSKQADIWKKNINISGMDFEIQYKHGKQRSIFCEVNPSTQKIYINWDHPIRGTMGDAGYIKHCLATVASSLPQEQLNTYVKLITNKI